MVDGQSDLQYVERSGHVSKNWNKYSSVYYHDFFDSAGIKPSDASFLRPNLDSLQNLCTLLLLPVKTHLLWVRTFEEFLGSRLSWDTNSNLFSRGIDISLINPKRSLLLTSKRRNNFLSLISLYIAFFIPSVYIFLS